MDTTTKFSVGTIVCLKSGSPRMTIIERCKEGRVLAQWFSHQRDDFTSTFFFEDALELVEQA